MYPYQNMLPQQQILQANGKESISQLRMYPNSSVLVADTTAPIIWKCVSDGIGNVTATAFDITPHKDEAQVEKETIMERLDRLEKQYESFISRASEPTTTTDKVYVPSYARGKEPTTDVKPTGFSKPQHETGARPDKQ